MKRLHTGGKKLPSRQGFYPQGTYDPTAVPDETPSWTFGTEAGFKTPTGADYELRPGAIEGWVFTKDGRFECVVMPPGWSAATEIAEGNLAMCALERAGEVHPRLLHED